MNNTYKFLVSNIKCDGCEKWYHPRCCKLSDSEAENMNEFFCLNCNNNMK